MRTPCRERSAAAQRADGTYASADGGTEWVRSDSNSGETPVSDVGLVLPVTGMTSLVRHVSGRTRGSAVWRGEYETNT
jgi:hypothetical protein